LTAGKNNDEFQTGSGGKGRKAISNQTRGGHGLNYEGEGGNPPVDDLDLVLLANSKEKRTLWILVARKGSIIPLWKKKGKVEGEIQGVEGEGR